MHDRLRNAVSVLENGGSIRIGDIYLGINFESNKIIVKSFSIFINIKFLNKEQAVKELQDIKNLFKKMRISSDIFKGFVDKFDVEYCLLSKEGQGDLCICKELNGQITWNIDLK